MGFYFTNKKRLDKDKLSSFTIFFAEKQDKSTYSLRFEKFPEISEA